MKNKFHFKRLTLRFQLTLIMSVVVVTAFALIILDSYSRQKQFILEDHIKSTRTILELESENLKMYIQELRDFCVRPCLNAELYNSIQNSHSWNDSDIDSMKKEIRSEVRSRTDIRSYRITLTGPQLCFDLPQGGQHVNVYPAEDISNNSAFLACGQSSRYEYAAPSESSNTFFCYYHYLIRIRGKVPVSLTRIEVGPAQLDLILKNHSLPDESICILNPQNEVLYSNLSDNSLAELTDENFSAALLASSGSEPLSLDLGGAPYMGISVREPDSGFTLLSLLPENYLNERLRETLPPTLLQLGFLGILVWSLLSFMIRIITVPLTQLTRYMVKTGEGDFSPITLEESCREVQELSESYNDMVDHIDTLIKTNYLAGIREKEARLQALEAQMNPHFLYNTLQAIATEALMDDNLKLYEMIVSLSSNLRYTIKGEEQVPLEKELTYVDNYIFLQNSRLGDRLEVTREISPECMEIRIPKISIQLLVENAILHGLSDHKETLHIHIKVWISDGLLQISVKDDGRGIEKERLEALREKCRNTDLPPAILKDSIGLANLASRLHILYPERSGIELESEPGNYTEVILYLQTISYS